MYNSCSTFIYLTAMNLVIIATIQSYYCNFKSLKILLLDAYSTIKTNDNNYLFNIYFRVLLLIVLFWITASEGSLVRIKISLCYKSPLNHPVFIQSLLVSFLTVIISFKKYLNSVLLNIYHLF